MKNCTFGAYVELGGRCIAEETVFGDYIYLFGSNHVPSFIKKYDKD